MSTQKTNVKKPRMSPEQRNQRIQQILFSALALIVVASMLITALK